MRRISIVGIGAGDPDDITVAAVKALQACDVFFVIEKPGARSELARARREILARHVPDGVQRIVSIEDPERDRGATAYVEAVEEWRRRRADAWEVRIAEIAEGGRGAFLVWGDPALYDSTIAVLDEIAARGNVDVELDVLPGISAVASLTARHRIALNRVGRAVQITTGRRLADGWPADADDIVVMLDAGCAFAALEDAEDVDIYWGAYLGTDDEILICGPLVEVADEVVRVRAEARERKGWIMDTYLLRRAPNRAPRRPS